jgi:anti-sigma B factor antagonist
LIIQSEEHGHPRPKPLSNAKIRRQSLRGCPPRRTLWVRILRATPDGILKQEEQPAMQLSMSTRTLDGAMVVDCSGRLVFGEESASLREVVKKLVLQSPKVVLNLHEVNYIDSGGLGTLVSLYTTARNAGGSVKLARLSQRVGDLLQVTKLLTIFEVFDDEEKAARSFHTAA